MSMQAKVIEFANLLRKSGVRVSVAEAIDAFQSLDELSLDDREIFKDALRASMVKRGDEIPTYDQLFDLFWSGFYDSLQQGFGDVNADLAKAGIDVDDLLRQLAEMMSELDDGELDLSELAKALLTQDLSNLEQMIRDACESFKAIYGPRSDQINSPCDFTELSHHLTNPVTTDLL